MKTAYVNGTPISREAVQFELDRLIKFYVTHGTSKETITANLEKLVERAQEQAIGAKLLLDRAAELEVQVPESEIDGRIAEIKKQLGSEEAFKKALEARKTDEKSFREELRRGCRVDALVRQAVAHVPEPSEEDIEAYYRAHPGEFASGPQVFARHILVTPADKESEASKREAREEIEAIRKRILEGADFKDEARAHSDCPSAKDGGSLGWFSRGMMVGPFDKAVFSIAKNEISDVVETQFGYHIILKEDERPGGSKSLTEAHESIRDLLRHEARGRAMDSFVAELREKASVEYK